MNRDGENVLALPLQCLNDQCLYKKNVESNGCMDQRIVEASMYSVNETVCELPLEYSFETDTMGSNVICSNKSELYMRENNKSSDANYNARDPPTIYSPYKQPYREDFASNSYVRQVQSTNDSNYFDQGIPTYPPCLGPQPWDYGYCYGYYGDGTPCQFSGVVDMEDFM